MNQLQLSCTYLRSQRQLAMAMPDVSEESDILERPEPRFGPRAMLVSALVGFAIGVLLTVAFSPLLSLAHHHNAAHFITPTPLPLSRNEVLVRTRQLADQALSYEFNGKPHRLLAVSLSPAIRINPGRFPLPTGMTFVYNAVLTFVLNPNFVGVHFQILGAENDCLLFLKELYTHQLPLNDIELNGIFQFPGARNASVVMRAGSNSAIESKLAPWKSVSPQNNLQRVWNSLRPHFISERYRHYVPRA